MKIFILDTNVVLTDPYAATSFHENTVVIPMTVLEELDSIKSRKVDVSRDARVAIRQIATIVENASHKELTTTGVRIADTHPNMPDAARLIIVQDVQDPHPQDVINGLKLVGNTEVPDNRIINSALYYQWSHPDQEVILVTNDINMRIKAQGAGVQQVQAYSHDTTVSDVDLLQKGYIEVDGDFWSCVEIISDERTDRGISYKLKRNSIFDGVTINDYLFDDEFTLVRVLAHDDESVTVLAIDREHALKRSAWGIKSKDIYQAMAINSLLDPTIDLTVLLGSAGTGKTLVTLACALEQALERDLYGKIIFSRSLQSQFEDIGFLPGNEHEKVSPWAGGAFDALEYLHKDDANPVESVKHIVEDRKIIQFKALNFIRGRSFKDTILVIDEAQNLTAVQMKTIISRAGENCKVILMGNLAQIDNDYVSAVSSGLTYVSEKFKDTELASIIQLKGVIRSRLAEFAENNL